MNYILIDATTRAPVPLPFHTTQDNEPITVHDFNDSCISVTGLDKSLRTQWIRPALCGLVIITEVEFMAEVDQRGMFIPGAPE